MALKSGIVCCARRSLVFTAQPALSTSFVHNVSQKCHLSTSNVAPFVSNHLLLGSSSHVSRIFGAKLTLPETPNTIPNMQQVRDYHSVLRPRLHCKGCYFVWRHGRKYVECSDLPSHKQMKKVANRKLWKEDYTKGNVRRAMNWNRDLLRIDDRMGDRTALSHNWLADRIGKDV